MFGLFRSASTTSNQWQRQHKRQLSLEHLDERAMPVTGLGAASIFAVLGINGGTVTLNSSTIVGDIGLGPNEGSVLKKTTDTGTFFVDPTSDPDLSRWQTNFNVSGGMQVESLVQAQQDANSASTAYAALLPTQSFGSTSSSLTITGNGGTNVISLGSLNYNSKTMTLAGSATDVFIFNVTGGFKFSQSKIQLTGGVTASHVVFNFPTTGSEIDLGKATSVINGTFLAPLRSLNYHNPAVFNGAVIAEDINIHLSAKLNYAGFAPPSTGPTTGTGSLSGRVLFDADQDHSISEGDTGLGGIVIYLTNANGDVWETTTDDEGNFSFNNLAAGTYSIQRGPVDANYAPMDPVLGTLDGNANYDAFSNIQVGDGANGTGYIFGLRDINN